MKFSDLGIVIKRNGFTDPKVSINDILNIPVRVVEFKPEIETVNGKRHLVRIEVEGMHRVFFTASSQLMKVLEHQKIQFPFETIIKSFKVGDKRGYEFT